MNKVFVGAILATLCMSSCGKKEKLPQVVRSVEVVTPESMGAIGEKSFSGVVKEVEEIQVGFKEAGQIEQILVKEGDLVRKGQIIARLDAKDYDLEYKNVQIQYNQTKIEVARLERLYSQNALSGNEYEKALAGLEQLTVRLQQNKNKLDYTILRAPVTGYIQDVNFSISEMVNSGTAIFTLIDVNRFEVETDIPAYLYLKQKEFTGFSCTSAQFPGESFPLNLISINQKANANQLYKVRFSMSGEALKKLTAGMNVAVVFNVRNEAQVIEGCMIPESSLFQSRERKESVWILNADSTVSMRTVVSMGLLPGGKVQIKTGLMPGERVVKAGVNVLQEKEKVKVIPSPSPTNVGGMI